MAIRRISQIDPVLSVLDNDGNPLSPDALRNQVAEFVKNNPLMEGYLMEVSKFTGPRPNAPSYYLSKQLDLSTLITIINAGMMGSLDEQTTFTNFKYGPNTNFNKSNSELSNTFYRDTGHHGINTFRNDVYFERSVIIDGAACYRDGQTSATMTTNTGSRASCVLSVAVPSRFTYPINACAMSAWWADLAETYDADAPYEPGTLVQFGGEREITVATTEVNAVVTSTPGFVLNAPLSGMTYEHPVAVALTGRTPVLVAGPVEKFNKIALDPERPGTGRVADANCPNVIAVALESNPEPGVKPVTCSTRFRF